MMEVDQHEEHHLVNGGLMRKYGGEMVRLYLLVENTSTGGRQVQGKTTDKKTVNVALESPLNQPLDGWIEVIGRPADNGSTINCSEIIVFPVDENSEPFEEEAHNALVLLMDNMQEFYAVED